MEEKIAAFPDGYSLVSFNNSVQKLVVGNSEGLAKVFDVDEPELEPDSIDISNFVTSIAHHGKQALMTHIDGSIDLVDLESLKSNGSIFRSELPLRDCTFIHDGKRAVCGGDDLKLNFIDLNNGNKLTSITTNNQVLNVSYNFSGELLSVSLVDGEIQIYSVVNEHPNLIKSFKRLLYSKLHTSMDCIDFNGEHKEELLATRAQWSPDGEHLYVPTETHSIKIFKRADWDQVAEIQSTKQIFDFDLSPNGKHAAVLFKDCQVVIYELESKKSVRDFTIDNSESFPINLKWYKVHLYVGTSMGEILKFPDVVESVQPKGLESLFVDEAEELEVENNTDTLLNEFDEELNADDVGTGYKLHQEDSMMIDEEEDDYSYKMARVDGKPVKRPRFILKPPFSGHQLKPYSPGCTPWKNESDTVSSADRRYLYMSSLGYVWTVKNLAYGEGSAQQTITVSFFDRSNVKDYHFSESIQYDLCSMNSHGILLANSGYQANQKVATIYYRGHEGTQDSWEKGIPLLADEFITSIALTCHSEEEGEAVVAVGTNLGYLRILSSFGVYLHVIKSSPVVTSIASPQNVIMTINQSSANTFTYSILDAAENKFIQQEMYLPIKKSANDDIPLIKGLFFNEFGDPCIVPGDEDTLLILQSWRETNNAKWVPLLNCKDELTEYGNNSNKLHWKSWPLGLYGDKLNCLILRNKSQYPDFPLPLPIELDIKIPIATNGAEDKNEDEELMLRSLTMGKIVSESLNEDEDEEIMERLHNYSVALDRSLLKLFGDACKDYRLKKAFSIARLIKTDKGLFTALKICERMNFTNLASRVSRLREAMIEL